MKENILKSYKEVCKCIFNDIPANAIVILRSMIANASRITGQDLSVLLFLLEKEEMNLASMLNYSLLNEKDIDEFLFINVKRNLLVVADKVKASLHCDITKNRDISILETYISSISSYYKSKKLSEVLGGMSISTNCDINKRDEATKLMFDHIRYSYFLSNEERDKIVNILSGNDIEEREKALIVSALTLSLIKEFDEYKIQILILSIGYGRHASIRAKVAIVLISYLYNERIKLYKDLSEKIESLANADLDFFADIYIQLIRSKCTSQKESSLDDLTNVIKNNKDLTNKLFDKKIIIDEDDAVFSSLTSKVKGFINQQTNGDDVNFSPKLHLESSSFFNDIYTYFLPFSLEESEIYNNFGKINKEKELSFFVIYSNNYLCDVDKFHTVLSMKKVGKMMDKVINAVPNSFAKPMDKIILSDIDIMRNYIFNLYRFFYFSSSASIYKNPFYSLLQMYNLHIYNNLSDKNITDLTNVYFANKLYDDILKLIEKFHVVCSSELFLRKKGIVLSLQGKFNDAIVELEKANIIKERTSTYITLSDCYESIGDSEKSIICLENATKLKKNDYKIKLKLVEKYINFNMEQKAINMLSFLEYDLIENGNTNSEDLIDVKKIYLDYERYLVRRHILDGNIDIALNYMSHIKTHFNMDITDKIMFAHFELANGNFDKAKQMYLSIYTNSNEMYECFSKDVYILSALGIEKNMQKLYINCIINSMC